MKTRWFRRELWLALAAMFFGADFNQEAFAGRDNRQGDGNSCKLEGNDVGDEGETIRVGDIEIEFYNWVKRANGSGYVGFSVRTNVGPLTYVVKADQKYNESGTPSFLHPNGTGAGYGDRIRWVDFCNTEIVEPPPPARPEPKKFAQISGQPTGVACVGDGPGGDDDRLIVTSWNPGKIYSIDYNGQVERLLPAPKDGLAVNQYPLEWSSKESYLALSLGLGDWDQGVLYATHGHRVYRFSKDMKTSELFVELPKKGQAPNGVADTHSAPAFDRTGVWDYDLLVSGKDGELYRIKPNGSYQFVASVNAHHESPRVLTDDLTKWGDLAGCATTASENTSDQGSGGSHGRVFWICPDGSTGTFMNNVEDAETSDIRPSSGETTFEDTEFIYFASRNDDGGWIWGYPAGWFPDGSQGDMFVSREFDGGITHIRGTTNLSGQTTLVRSDVEGRNGQHYEGSNFCFKFGERDTAEDCNDGIDNDGDGKADAADPDCQVCGDGDVDNHPDMADPEECDDGNTDGGDGCSNRCTLECTAPTARCQDVVIAADAGVCTVATASIDNGSTAVSGTPILSQSNVGPFPVGVTQVTLTVTDPSAGNAACAVAACTGTVTVVDTESPVVTCNEEDLFGAQVTDNCGITHLTTEELGFSEVEYNVTDGAGNQVSKACETNLPICPASN